MSWCNLMLRGFGGCSYINLYQYNSIHMCCTMAFQKVSRIFFCPQHKRHFLRPIYMLKTNHTGDAFFRPRHLGTAGFLTSGGDFLGPMAWRDVAAVDSASPVGSSANIQRSPPWKNERRWDENPPKKNTFPNGISLTSWALRFLSTQNYNK